MKKIELPSDTKNDIIVDYQNGFSIRKLVNKYQYSFTVIQKLINSFNFEKNIQKNYPSKDGFKLIAKCKISGKEFNDYNNTSGALTNHIQSIYNIDLPTKYKRKSIEYQTGKFWYDKYFTFEYQQLKPTKQCLYCDWNTKDVDNLSGAYEKHLKQIHNKSLVEYFNDFPNERKYFKKEIYDELVKCEICGKSFKYLTNTHLNKHGISQLEYKIEFGILPVSIETKEKLKTNYNLYLKNSPNLKTSKIENFIIDNIPINFIQSDRNILNGKEIDLLYNNNIGFEINGVIFHTEIFGKKDRNYHLNKTLLANSKNIKLYHIFDDEIINHPNIVISKIKHMLNNNDNVSKIHARKCSISNNVSSEEKSKFLNENHIQGNDKSNHIVVAKYDNEIVAIMTFNNKRHMNKNKNHNNNIYELSRFCVKNNIVSSGIASKLLKSFINQHKPSKIISFADRRWTPDANNNLYVKLGFELTQTLKPDYWYYNPKIHRNKRFHKFGFGKSNLKKRFPEVYDNNKTEWMMMQELGYDRIWDCGKFKYELNII